MAEDLLALLNEEADAQDTSPSIKDEKTKKTTVVAPQKADKSATLYNFIEMVGKLCSKVLSKDGVKFEFDEGKRLSHDTNEKIDHPFITYKIISRKPKMELKPRERESAVIEQTDSDKDGRQGRIYGQKFSAYVQFNIIASEYTLADSVMNVFEDIIFSYTGYLKKNGVAEILFHEHTTDKDYDIYRQNLSVRNLVYYVEVEKLFVMFDSEIDDVLIK